MAIEIVDIPMKNGWIFPWQNVSSPEGNKNMTVENGLLGELWKQTLV